MDLKHLGTLSIYGDRPAVFVTEYAVEHRWVFPEDRFVEYEPKDEAWARPLGYGREETVPAAFLYMGRWLVHPSLVRVWEKAMDRLENPLRGFWQREYGYNPVPNFVIQQ